MTKLQKIIKLCFFVSFFIATFSFMGGRAFAEVEKCLLGPGLVDCSKYADLIQERTRKALDPAKCYTIMNGNVKEEDCTRAPFNLKPNQTVAESVVEQAEQDVAATAAAGGFQHDTQGAGGTCGSGDTAVGTTVDLGCKGKGNGIDDLLFAIIRFLVAGVGVVVIASVIVGGIQYSLAQGEPQKIAAARGRVISALGALLLYLFIFALMQWLVPGGVF